MKSDPKLMRYAPQRQSVKLATRTQHGAFRLSYAAAVAMAFLFSGLAPAALMALIWRETSLSPMVFELTFIIALTHSIGVGLPLFLICQLRGWINLVSCVVLGAFIGILPAGILAYPTQLSGFIAGAWTGALTDPDGVITAAIWDGYIKPLIYFGLLGAWGGFVFWAVLKCWGMVDGGRQNIPDNAPEGSSIHDSAMTSVLPELSALLRREPGVYDAARHARSARRSQRGQDVSQLASTTAWVILMNQMVVEAEQNLDPVDNGLHTATSASDNARNGWADQ